MSNIFHTLFPPVILFLWIYYKGIFQREIYMDISNVFLKEKLEKF